MGKNWSRKKRNRPNLPNGGWKTDQNGKELVVVRENELFAQFYKAQNIVQPTEWEAFMAALRRDLPISFRFVGCNSESDLLLKVLHQRYLSQLTDVEVDGEKLEPAKNLEWYPNGLAYQIQLPRRVLRKHALLNNLHNFLVTESELGNVSRQETVSMIPPLLLEIDSKSRIFDMCAAPGSKTAQLIEMLHGDHHTSVPTGFVLANDENNKRCYLLVHQSLKRLNSPCCLVVNCDAACIPYPKILNDDDTIESVKFDQILCDVPCSGDGTMRKNLQIWKTWSPYQGYNLHRIQLRIAKRGLEMLQVGGLMVYSTCSFNPAENEATVASLIDFGKGAIEIVDVSSKLHGLKRSPGLLDWKVMDKEGNFYDSFNDVPENKRRFIPETIFAPKGELSAEIHLENCMRLLPHHQDTGGFFVALLRKKTEFPWVKPNSHVKTMNLDTLSKLSTQSAVSVRIGDSFDSSPPRKQRKFQGFKEDPFVFLKSDDESWQKVEKYFDIAPGFPVPQLLRRGQEGNKKRNLYFVNDIVKRIIENNSDNIKIINAGTRLFNRIDVKEKSTQIRLTQDGIEILRPYIRKRIVNIARNDLVDALTKADNNCYQIGKFESAAQDQFNQLDEGSVVLSCNLDSRDISVCGWKLKTAVSPFLSKESSVHVLRLLHYDTTALENEMLNTKRRKNAAENSKKDEGVGIAVGENDEESASLEQRDSIDDEMPIEENVDESVLL